MPRPIPWPPPIYARRGRAFCRVHVALGRTKDVTLGPAGSDEAKAAYTQLLAQLEGNGRRLPPEPAGLTVAGLLAEYLRWAEARYGRTGHLDRIKRGISLSVALYGATSAAAFGPVALGTVRDGLVQAGYARGEISATVGCLRRAWKWGVGRELVPLATWQALGTLGPLPPGVGGPSRRTGPVPAAHVEATLPQLRPLLRDMVRLQQLSGMRPGELFRLTTVTINRSGEVQGVGTFPGLWVYEPVTHKTQHRGKRRIIFLGPAAQAILGPYLEKNVQVCKDGFTNLLFVTNYGNPWDRHAYRQEVVRACQRAGVPEWSPYRLRASAATAVAVEHGLDAAAAVIGDRPDVALKHYVETAALAAKAMRECG